LAGELGDRITFKDLGQRIVRCALQLPVLG